MIRFSRRFLTELKLSQVPAYKLAAEAGLPASTLSLMVHGGYTIDPSDERLISIGETLGLKKKEIFEEEKETDAQKGA